jgi:hypothetical protein
MPQIELEFDLTKGYGDVVLKGRTLSKTDYMQLPIVKWAVKNVGELRTDQQGQVLYGDGWEIFADWQTYLNGLDKRPRVVLKLTQQVDQRLITDFWMRFQ